MARSMNKMFLIGYVGDKPEARTTKNGKLVVTFDVATTRRWRSKSGQSDWHKVRAWEKLAQIVNSHVKKGDRVFVEGNLQYEEWEKDGVKKRNAIIVIEEIMFLSNKDDAGSDGGDDYLLKPKDPLQDDDEEELPF